MKLTQESLVTDLRIMKHWGEAISRWDLTPNKSMEGDLKRLQKLLGQMIHKAELLHQYSYETRFEQSKFMGENI